MQNTAYGNFVVTFDKIYTCLMSALNWTEAQWVPVMWNSRKVGEAVRVSPSFLGINRFLLCELNYVTSQSENFEVLR